MITLFYSIGYTLGSSFGGSSFTEGALLFFSFSWSDSPFDHVLFLTYTIFFTVSDIFFFVARYYSYAFSYVNFDKTFFSISFSIVSFIDGNRTKASSFALAESLSDFLDSILSM